MTAWRTRIRHLGLAAACLPTLLRWPAHREQLGEMRRLCRQLPGILRQPITQAMAQLTPERMRVEPLPEPETTRRLADLTALLERESPLGLCLRRSLLRFHYLRRLGVPVVVQFGAKFGAGFGVMDDRRDGAGDEQKDITGHAWLTLDGRPYHEDEDNWRDYTVMLSWPPGASEKLVQVP